MCLEYVGSTCDQLLLLLLILHGPYGHVGALVDSVCKSIDAYATRRGTGTRRLDLLFRRRVCRPCSLAR
jgi:hypothetical protein